MIKKQLLKISLTTFFITQQALAAEQALATEDASEALNVALHDDNYTVVRALMRHTANRTAKSNRDHALDHFIISINCAPFDQQAYERQLRKLQALTRK